MEPVSPVVNGMEEEESVYAKDQKQYMSLPSLRSRKEGDERTGPILTRWTFTEEERAAIANGADLFVRVLTFNQLLQPIGMFIAYDDENLLRYFIENYR